MATVEERVSFLEGRVVEQSNLFADIRETLASLDRRVLSLEQRLDHRFERLDTKMSTQFMWLIGILVTTLGALLVTTLRH